MPGGLGQTLGGSPVGAQPQTRHRLWVVKIARMPLDQRGLADAGTAGNDQYFAAGRFMESLALAGGQGHPHSGFNASPRGIEINGG